PLRADRVAAVYVPRSPTTGVLYGVVRTHLTEFLAAVDAQTDGGGLPGVVVGEVRKFLRCRLLAHGFARVRCGGCAFERLVAGSCRSRAKGARSVRAAGAGGWLSARRTSSITCCRLTCPSDNGSSRSPTGCATGLPTITGSAAGAAGLRARAPRRVSPPGAAP